MSKPGPMPPRPASAAAPQALVFGRLGADLYPTTISTPLEEVRFFERFVGGFAGNVATGLARLRVRTAILSAVGDDGHGRFVRRFLTEEGVDVSHLSTHPTLLTPLAFCEVWPPDHFPITFYRAPSAPDWEIGPGDLPEDVVRAAGLLYVNGTGLVREPSRAASLRAVELRAGRPTILDLDWREHLWATRDDFGRLVRVAGAGADTWIGGESEFAAAGIEPSEALGLGARVVVLKRGPDGARVHRDGAEHDIPGIRVEVLNGLGAGDAFAAAYGAAILAGEPPERAAARGNAAGAIVATRLACSAAMPRPDEIDALLDDE